MSVKKIAAVPVNTGKVKARKKFSIQYKVMLLLTMIPVLTLAAYLVMAVSTFEDDKLKYINGSSSSMAQSIASQTKVELTGVLARLRPLMQEYIDTGKIGPISKSLIHGDSVIRAIGIYKLDPNQPSVYIEVDQTEKEEGAFATSMSSPKMASWIKETSQSGRLVRIPNGEANIMLFERVGDVHEDRHFILAASLYERELADLYTSPSSTNLFLVSEQSETQLGPSFDSFPDWKELLETNFVQKFVASHSSAGTETIRLKNKESWLVSYTKAGFGDLLIVSVIDKQTALKGTKTLLRKSLWFFLILIAVTIIVSTFASAGLTSAIVDLVEATKKVSQGTFNFKVRVTTNDEVGSLAESFNIMADEVARLIGETAEKARMEGELKTAQTVQETLFPYPQKAFDNFSIAGQYEPASECGGDWWYYSEVGSKVYLWIGDATGHGAPAALVTSAARSAASIIEQMNVSSAQAMELMNRSICDVTKGKIMMTFFLAIFDRETNKFTYSNASHEPPFLIHKAPDTKLTKKHLVPLNDVNNARLGQARTTVYEEQTIELRPGDFIIFYTDGLADLKSPTGESLGERALTKIMLESLNKSNEPSEVVETMRIKMTEHRGKTPLIDDVTYFVVAATEPKKEKPTWQRAEEMAS